MDAAHLQQRWHWLDVETAWDQQAGLIKTSAGFDRLASIDWL
jgi:hypothetical protein